MYIGISLFGFPLTGSLYSVSSAVVCSSVVGSTASYSPGFISNGQRECSFHSQSLGDEIDVCCH